MQLQKLLGIVMWFAICCVNPLTVVSAFSADGIESTYAEHTRGVELARAGQYEEGLRVLLPLLARFPDEYPLQRDIILITIWKGDCQDALQRFERLRARQDLEPYLVAPVSRCLLDANRPKEARYLTRQALQRHPDDVSLQNAFLEADLALRIDENIDEDRPALAAEVTVRETDRDAPEWITYLEGSTKIAERTRVYARYRFTRALEKQYQSGDLDRLGVGARYRIDERWLLDQEFSADVRDSGQTGSTTRVTYEPRDDWRLALAYASFSEDIPLQARAVGVEARQASGEIAYESRNYRWDGLATISSYDFSDTNRRTAFFAHAGYAYELRALREQRLYLEWYQSTNTLDGTAYFNPRRDFSLGLVHRTDFIFTSSFKRHVDHLWIGASAYTQQDYGTHGRWSLGYEQDYDFDESRALVAGGGVARNVYDGKYETEWRFYVYFHQRF
ncbi:MAG TPA: hypothetical protein DIC36_03020 [Gammaproteobacteria bacterium]|nr:hypothetical protein [Gammaproteobacteria bacterium]